MGASGTTTIDFGAFPGSADASVAVTGQAAIVAGSLVEAWIRPVATADHSADEHLADPPRVVACEIVAGTGFTIRGFMADPATATPDPWPDRRQYLTEREPRTPRPYGQWTVAWVWN